MVVRGTDTPQSLLTWSLNFPALIARARKHLLKLSCSKPKISLSPFTFPKMPLQCSRSAWCEPLKSRWDAFLLYLIGKDYFLLKHFLNLQKDVALARKTSAIKVGLDPRGLFQPKGVEAAPCDAAGQGGARLSHLQIPCGLKTNTSLVVPGGFGNKQVEERHLALVWKAVS